VEETSSSSSAQKEDSNQIKEKTAKNKPADGACPLPETGLRCRRDAPPPANGERVIAQQFQKNAKDRGPPMAVTRQNPKTDGIKKEKKGGKEGSGGTGKLKSPLSSTEKRAKPPSPSASSAPGKVSPSSAIP